MKGQKWRHFTTEGRNRCQDRVKLENVYYDVIHDTLREVHSTEMKYITLQALKAKIVKLHRTHLSCLFLDAEDLTEARMKHPRCTTSCENGRQDSRMIKTTLNNEGELQTTPSGILRTFTQFFQTTYFTINTDNENIARMARHIKTTVPPKASALFDSQSQRKSCIRRSNMEKRRRHQVTMVYVTTFTS